MATGEGSQLVYTPSVMAVVRESQEGIVYNKCLIHHSLPCSFLGGILFISGLLFGVSLLGASRTLLA